MFQLGKATSKTRNPPPAPKLPSQTPSQVSLPGIMASGLSASAPRAPAATVPGSTPGRSAPLLRESKTANAPPTLNLNLPIQLTRGESTRATDRTDALWAEMQATLEEVELSANGGTRVFGPDHERKLGELRVAQIALAQAWARSEADDAIETLGAKPSAVGDGGAGEGAGRSEAGGATDGGAKSTAGTGSARPGSSGVGAGGQERFSAKLDEETEVDILLARKRREANDRYFKRVNQGVLDVVAKLEEVATAMRAVEAESKDIWGEGEGDSAPGSAGGSIPASAKS